MTALDIWHGNIAGRRGHRRIKRRMRKHLDDVLIATEAYNARPRFRKWAKKYGYQLKQPTRAVYGPEGPDVAMLVRDDVEIEQRDVDKMDESWFGPFNYPRSRKSPRVIQTLKVRKAGIAFDIIGMHAPSGGPSGGTATRGRNAAAWHEYAAHVRTVLAKSPRGAAVGDANAKGSDVRAYVKPAGARVVMASNVDGVVAVGCQVIVRRLKSPRGMHGWMTVRLIPKEN